jgi:HEPN domain-containing protein
MHDLPPSLDESLQEVQSSLAIGNYRSCVVMCRRALEGLLKFAHERLLGKKPVTKKGKELMLNDLISAFRTAKAIPEHLLFAADSLRTLGNVPGAHAADIKDYQFTKYDAEFALSTLIYFNEQYFTKVDSDVRTYYTLTIEPES